MNDHIPESELQKRLDAAKQQVSVGAQYCHYKGADKIYTVACLGILEATEEVCIIYEAQYGEHLTFIRPLKVWLETVEWQGNTVPRFRRLT